MKGYIHETTLECQKSTSGKAIYLTVRFGTSEIHDRFEWFPLSQLKIGQPNECGWSPIEIPNWLIKNKNLQNAILVELENQRN